MRDNNIPYDSDVANAWDSDGFESYDEEDLLGEDDAPQSNFSEIPPRSFTSSAPEICVICHGAPALRNGPNTHSTCGKARVSKLKLPAANGPPDPNKPGTSDPPNSAYGSSAPPNLFDNNSKSLRRSPKQIFNKACVSQLQAANGLPGFNKPGTSDPPSSAYRSSAPPNPFDNKPKSLSRSSEQTYTVISRPPPHFNNQIRICIVCHVRPQYQRGDKKYPTCGLSCAAKLQTSESGSEMCDYCKKRPKNVVIGKKYPHCGRTCRDKAKRGCGEVCTCIFCWESMGKGESDHLADIWAPFLIEIPQDHVAFQKVADLFTSDWKVPTHCPTIKKAYMVVVKKSLRTSFKNYRNRVGNEVFRYHGTGRSQYCTLGKGGDTNTQLCSTSTPCPLCSILRTSFNVGLAKSSGAFGAGVYTSSASNKSYSFTQGGSGAILVTKVVLGKVRKVTAWNEVMNCPPGFDSVVFDRQNGQLNETIVYAENAIRPAYLLLF